VRTLASIAKAAVDAFSDQRDGFSLAGALAETHDRAGSVQDARPLKFLEQTSRSLIAEIEVKAHYDRATLQTMALRLDGAVVANAFSFERRLLGLGTGIHDGAIVVSTMWEPRLMPWLCHRLQDFSAFEMATFRIVGPGMAHAALDPMVIRNRVMTAIMSARKMQEVMPLDDGFAHFLERLGRSTRQNVSRSLQQAAAENIDFSFVSGAAASTESALQKLAAKNMPLRQSFSKIASIERFVAAQPRPYQAYLTHRDGRLISLAGGFIEGDRALIAYQLNHRADRETSPSLTLRSFLVERLIGEGVRSLAFIGSCAGLLLHYCEPVPAAELLMVGNRRSARIRHRATVLAQPRGRVAQLSAELAKTLETQALR
jgi:hypothetical protein